MALTITERFPSNEGGVTVEQQTWSRHFLVEGVAQADIVNPNGIPGIPKLYDRIPDPPDATDGTPCVFVESIDWRQEASDIFEARVNYSDAIAPDANGPAAGSYWLAEEFDVSSQAFMYRFDLSGKLIDDGRGWPRKIAFGRYIVKFRTSREIYNTHRNTWLANYAKTNADQFRGFDVGRLLFVGFRSSSSLRWVNVVMEWEYSAIGHQPQWFLLDPETKLPIPDGEGGVQADAGELYDTLDYVTAFNMIPEEPECS